MQKKKLINYRPMFYCFLALLGSILFAKHIFQSDWFLIAIFIVIVAVVTTAFIVSKKFIAGLFLLLAICVGLAGYTVEMSAFSNEPFHATSNLEGRVSGSSATYGKNQYIVLEGVIVDGKPISQNIQLRIFGAPYLSVGDEISLVATITPISALDENNKVQTYAYKNNCYYMATKKSDIIIRENRKTVSEKVQCAVKEKLNQNMNEENAGIAYAMLFGDKSNVDYETKSAYRTSGIAHILAVSGLHVGIIVGALAWIMKKCRANRWVILIVITAILAFYSYLCNFTPSVVRASIMSFGVLFTNAIYRRHDTLSALGLAGVLILLFRPLYAFDIGFQLSFGCVIGIVIFGRSVFKFLRKPIKKFVLPKCIASPLATTISSQFLILPILLSNFDGVSFLTLFINLLIIPIFTVAFVMTFFATPLLFISDFFKTFLWFPNMLMNFIGDCAKFVSSQTWSIIPHYKFAFASFVCFFAFMFVCSRIFLAEKKVKLITSLVLACSTILVVGLLQLT